MINRYSYSLKMDSPQLLTTSHVVDYSTAHLCCTVQLIELILIFNEVHKAVPLVYRSHATAP